MYYINGTTVTWNDTAAGKYETRIEYSYTQNLINATTTITANLQARANNAAYSTTSYWTIDLQGTGSNLSNYKIGGTTNWQTLATKTWTVAHNADGKLENYNIYGSFYQTNLNQTYVLMSGSVSGNVTFPQINRGIININVAGTWKQGQVHVNVDGVWKQAIGVYTNVNGTWKQSI